MITVSTLNEVSRVRHAFFTRSGGSSEGVYAGLNCGFGSGDDPARVASNRAVAMARLEQGPNALVTVRQEHTNTVLVVDKPFPHDQAPVADALVTKRTNLVLGVLTADCAPVLLADGKGRVVAAVHAGWRGALAGVVDAAIVAMEGLGAKRARIVAAIGPSISRRSYEVGPEFPPPFLAEDADNAEFFRDSPRAGRYLFDLPGYLARRLARIGVSDVATTPCDTCIEADRFYSYRRSVMAGEAAYGRQLSAIVLEP